MRKLIEYFQDQLMHREALLLWEMANLTSDTTGIPNIVIFISPGHGLKHGPRIKVALGDRWSDNNVTIPLTGQPRVIGDSDLSQDQFAEILQWIRLNRKLLLQYWNGEIVDTKQLVNGLQPLQG